MLTTLRSIIQEVASAEDFKSALNVMVQRIAKALNSHACSIFLLDRRRGEYVLMATHGLNPQAVGHTRIPLNQGLVGLVGEREEPINLDDASRHARYLHIPEINEEIYRAFLGAPIIYHRKVLGVLVVQHVEPRRYDEAEEAFLVTLSAQLAAIIAHAEATGAIAGLLDPKEGGREGRYSGIPGAPGIGIGQGVVIYSPLDLDAVPDREPEDLLAELQLAESALQRVQEDFRQLNYRLQDTVPAEDRELFDVYQRILDNNNLGAEIKEQIHKGNWAQGALRSVIQAHVNRLAAIENDYLKERAADIKGLGQRVLMYLQKSNHTRPVYADQTILIGEELTISDLAEVPDGCLSGVISVKGSSSSHLAILARAMGVPTVMGVSDIAAYALQGKEIIVDGYYGQVYIKPTDTLRAEFERLIKCEHQLDATLLPLRGQQGQTQDGHLVALMVNTGLGADVGVALAAGAEGVGLYRTEIPFLTRDRFPSGEEQRVIYRQLLASFAPRPVTMRTLDVGGDKSLPYFPVKEDNPFLGWRGMRITLDHPEIFLVQLRAMLRASEGYNNLRIMLPMITDVSEADEAMRLLAKAYAEVVAEGANIEMPEVGVMIEVPSSVYQARALAKRVDFLSVGTNDLTQYLLAVDRNNPRVANLYDSLHPAVLRALIQTVEGGHQEGKHVSICGEVAGDPAAVLLLVAMGFDSLSMSAASLSRMKWVINHFTLSQMHTLLQEVLSMESAVMIRCHMELALEKAGLGELIRVGR